MLATTAGDQSADIHDRAILLLLSVYGLHAGEVRQLLLDSFDWEREQVTVTCPKTHRTRVYPLCHLVGNAILHTSRKSGHALPAAKSSSR